MREPVLRRATTQPAVHVRQHIGVFVVREYAGRSWRMTETRSWSIRIYPDRLPFGLKPFAFDLVGTIWTRVAACSHWGQHREPLTSPPASLRTHQVQQRTPDGQR